MAHITEFVKEINQEVDVEMIPLLKKFWDLGGVSYQCCIGNIIQNDPEIDNYELLDEENDIIPELAYPWIIITRKSIPILQELVGLHIIDIIDGSNGYEHDQYVKNNDNDICFIIIHPEYFEEYLNMEPLRYYDEDDEEFELYIPPSPGSMSLVSKLISNDELLEMLID